MWNNFKLSYRNFSNKPGIINGFHFFLEGLILNIQKSILLRLDKDHRSILTASLLIRSIRTIIFSITPPVALNAVSISTVEHFCRTSGWTRCYIHTASFICPIRTVFISITSPARWNALLISTSKLVWTAGFGSCHSQIKMDRNWWGTI